MPFARNTALVVTALALVATLGACTQEPRLADVRDLARRNSPVREVLKVPGVIREKPKSTADGGITFLLFAEYSQAISIPVVFKAERFPRKAGDITGLNAIVTGRFDGRRLVGEQLLLDTNNGPYQTDTTPPAE